MIGPIERALDVAEHDVRPARPRCLRGGPPAAGVDDGVGVAERDHRAEGGQTVAVDLGLGGEAALRPVAERGGGKTADRLDHRRAEPPGVIGRHGDHERALS